VTSIRVSLVDVYVLRAGGAGLECLVLRRGAGGRCPGSWETVHGHIEEGERPWQAAKREL
jgi:8-oxo-dGTP pyrophosphatase MutT (NUDIX family)